MHNSKNTPLVSVGMPTYNGAKFLDKSIQSILSQSYSNIELIISDNASSDDTAKICRHYKKTDNRVRYFRQLEMILPPKNFNFVLNKASGDYFMWAPDDDLWSKNAIKLMVKAHLDQTDKTIALISPRYRVIDFTGQERHDLPHAFPNVSNSTINFTQYLKESFYTSKGNIIFGLFKRNELLKVGGMYENASLAAIDIFTVHILLSKFKIYIIDDLLFFKRQNIFRDNFSQGGVTKVFRNILNIIRIVLSNLLPSNFIWLFIRTHQYLMFNQQLISTYPLSDRIILSFYNFFSSIQFLLLFLPHDVKSLKKREIIYSR